MGSPMTAVVFFFFFPVQRRRLLPFLQWCSNGWEEDDEMRKADYGMGSAAMFVLQVVLVSRQPAVVALPLLSVSVTLFLSKQFTVFPHFPFFFADPPSLLPSLSLPFSLSPKFLPPLGFLFFLFSLLLHSPLYL
jgi:hypothetical protein